jgi:hypothetical protein
VFFTKLGIQSRSAIFSSIWSNNAWSSAESRSGPGSEIARTAAFRAELEAFLVRVGAASIYDAPCGDFNWMRLTRLPPGAAYVGADIVAPMIEQLQREYGDERRRFALADIVEASPPPADIWLCRESLFHLSFDEIRRVLAHWRASPIPWFLATTTPTVSRNINIKTGSWRQLNMEIAPFDLGLAREYLFDGSPADPHKVVGVWRKPA